MVLRLYRLLLDGFEVLLTALIGLDHEVVSSMLVLLMGDYLLESLLPKRCNVALRKEGASCTSSRLLFLKTRCHFINN